MAYQADYYAGKNEDAIAAQLSTEGYQPKRVEDKPNSRYDNHRNTYEIVLAFLDGSADITVGNQTFHCSAGDRLEIAGLVPHSARVGPDGCVYLMVQKPYQTD